MQGVEVEFSHLSLRVGMDKGVPLPSLSSPEYGPMSLSPSWSLSPPLPTHHIQAPCWNSSTSEVDHGKGLRKGRDSFWRKNSKPYSQGQRVTPRSPAQRLRMEVERFYSRLRSEYGVILAQEAMERSIRDHWVELEHDVLGCPLCYVDPATGEVTFSRCSPFHPAHPFHCCPPFGRHCCLCIYYFPRILK